MKSLYFNDGYERRPFAARYGLVCYIDRQYRIGAVTRQFVELIGSPPEEALLPFDNSGRGSAAHTQALDMVCSEGHVRTYDREGQRLLIPTIQ